MAISTRDLASFPITVSLDRRRIFVLPSRHGVAFATALIVMLIGSMNYANSLGYLLSFLLASVALVSLLHTYRNLAGVAVSVAEPEPVFAGEALVVPVSFDNRGGPVRRAVCVTYPERLAEPAPPRRWRRQVAARHSLYLDLAADSLTQVEIRIDTTRRGRHELTGIEVVTRFPLGLFRAWTPLRGTQRGPAGERTVPRTIVYPAPVGSRPLPYAAATEALQHRPGQPGDDDFSGLRDYQAGDSPRRIHWKAAARSTVLPVKEFDGAAGAELVLDWSLTDPASHLESRLSQLARWVVDAERANASYALHLPGEIIDIGGGAAHHRRCLRALAAFAPVASSLSNENASNGDAS